MKNLKWFLGALVVGAMTMTSCDKKDDPVVVNPTEPTLEDAPAIDAPGAGKVTIAIRVPDGTCNGLVAVGSNGTEELKWDPAGTEFTLVKGTETWYQVTLTYAADMVVKVIAKNEAGDVTWNTQWGMNKEGEDPSVSLISGECTIDNTENGGEVKALSFTENQVVFIGVSAWKSAPCVARNEAGIASFTLTAAALPEGAQVGVVGNFADASWDVANPKVMTRNGNTYTISNVEVPAACQYKYVWSTDGTTWSWDYSEDGDNRDMPLTLKAVDEVKTWKQPA